VTTARIPWLEAALAMACSTLCGCTSILGTFDADGGGGAGRTTSGGSGKSVSAGTGEATSTGTGVGPVKRAFVTGHLFFGDFGQQDIFSICNAAANEAKLGGSWVPWVSAGGDFACTGGPWELVDSSAMVGSCADLFNNTLLHPIDVTQFGKPVLSGEVFAVWTGVSAKGGFAHPANCNAWQVNDGSSEGLVGDVRDTGPGWTEKLTLRCDKAARIYCFEN